MSGGGKSTGWEGSQWLRKRLRCFVAGVAAGPAEKVVEKVTGKPSEGEQRSWAHFPDPCGIQVQDTVRMSSVAVYWVKNSGPPVSISFYALPPFILMLTSPLLPKPFPPAQDLMLPGPAKFPRPKPLKFSPTVHHHCPFSLPRQLNTWSDQVCGKRYLQLHFKILMGSAKVRWK